MGGFRVIACCFLSCSGLGCFSGLRGLVRSFLLPLRPLRRFWSCSLYAEEFIGFGFNVSVQALQTKLGVSTPL